MSGRIILALAGILGGLAVVLGAFGAHGLRARLEPEALAAFETGVRYQLIHALALMCVGLWTLQAPQPLLRGAAGCLVVGTLLFSGSICLLSTRTLLPFGALRFLGPVTPLGGLLLIVGWALLTAAAWRVGRT